MNTILVILAFMSNKWVPQYTVEYPTEAACMAMAEKHLGKHITRPWAVCVPKIQGEVK